MRLFPKVLAAFRPRTFGFQRWRWHTNKVCTNLMVVVMVRLGDTGWSVWHETRHGPVLHVSKHVYILIVVSMVGSAETRDHWLHSLPCAPWFMTPHCIATLGLIKMHDSSLHHHMETNIAWIFHLNNDTDNDRVTHMYDIASPRCYRQCLNHTCVCYYITTLKLIMTETYIMTLHHHIDTGNDWTICVCYNITTLAITEKYTMYCHCISTSKQTLFGSSICMVLHHRIETGSDWIMLLCNHIALSALTRKR